MNDQGQMTVKPRSSGYTIAEIKEIAKDVVESRLFPGIATVQQAFTLMLLCDAENIHPIQAMQRFNIIQGRPAMKADAMLAEFLARGGRVKWLTMTDVECNAIFSHPSFAPDGVPSSFSLNDAKRAGLFGNPTWQKYPKNMLRARVISNGVRTVMPGISLGIYTPEEVADFEPAPPPRQVEARVVEPSGRGWVTHPTGPTTPATRIEPEPEPIRPETAARLEELMAEVGVTDYERNMALTRRGVDRVEDLTELDAAAMVRKLEQKLDKRRGVDDLADRIAKSPASVTDTAEDVSDTTGDVSDTPAPVADTPAKPARAHKAAPRKRQPGDDDEPYDDATGRVLTDRAEIAAEFDRPIEAAAR